MLANNVTGLSRGPVLNISAAFSSETYFGAKIKTVSWVGCCKNNMDLLGV